MTQTLVCVSHTDVINHVLQLGAVEIICSAAKVGQKVGHQFWCLITIKLLTSKLICCTVFSLTLLMLISISPAALKKTKNKKSHLATSFSAIIYYSVFT